MQDGDGLFLDRTAKGGRWTFRYQFMGKRRDMGLGSYPAISLSQARQIRDKWRNVINEGNDPVDVRKTEQEAIKAERDKLDPTFQEMTETVLESIKARLRGEGTRGRWLSPFTVHLWPAIGSKRISTLAAHDFRDALKPIWHTKHPTAEKAFQRARLVLREAQLMGYDVNPIIVDQAVRMLGHVNHVVTPTPSTPWAEIPALYERLPETNAGQCLRFMILTLVRLDGCTGITLDEVDEDEAVWTVPADRVKGVEGKVTDFRVPLSRAAMALIADQARFHDGTLFAGLRGGAITDRALEVCLDKLKEKGRPHGFRSSFRTWVQDVDACSWEVSETVLGHKIGNKVERSYARSDLLERRRTVMEAWADHVTGTNVATVTKLRG